MKIGLKHSRYIANKIVVNLNKSNLIVFSKGLEKVVEVSNEAIVENINQEKALEERVREMIFEKQDKIDDEYLDERELFRMMKRELAPEYGFIMSYEERFSALSHTLLDILIDEDLLSFRVEKVRIKAIIFESIADYIDSRFQIEDIVYEKLEKYKKKLFPGTDEYKIVFDRLYEEELRRSGGMI
jgi:hypothetical protein